MSPRSDDDERFHAFVARSTAPLTRLAYLLCGDQHLANDLVQTCFVRLYQMLGAKRPDGTYVWVTIRWKEQRPATPLTDDQLLKFATAFTF